MKAALCMMFLFLPQCEVRGGVCDWTVQVYEPIPQKGSVMMYFIITDVQEHKAMRNWFNGEKYEANKYLRWQKPGNICTAIKSSYILLNATFVYNVFQDKV